MASSHRTLVAALVALSAALPAADALDAQDAAAETLDAIAEPRFHFEAESSSHIVRREADRLLVRYDADRWEFEGLAATLTPRFREERDQLGVLLGRGFGRSRLVLVARFTDQPGSEDLVGSLGYEHRGAGGTWGAEATFGRADLASEAFLLGDAESQFHGRLFWTSAGGLEVETFVADRITYDLARGTRDLLRRLPRSELVGSETLTDLYVDEDRLEDSAGLRVGLVRHAWRASLYVKSGEQTLRGFPVGDDFTGAGGELRIDTHRLHLRTELDLRRLEPADGFDAFDRGRLLVDFRHRLGRFEWGLGGFVQGEAETFADIPDLFDTTGGGLTLAWQLRGGRWLGLWAMSEEDAPDSERIGRLAFFTRRGESRWGFGVRRDEVGEARFVDETVGPFVFAKARWRQLILDADLGVQDGDAYGRIAVGLRR